MKKGFFKLFGTWLILLPTLVFANSELKQINFKQLGEKSLLEFVLDKDGAQATRAHLKDKQIIIDLKNISSTKKVLRAFDTSEFSGSVVFVSPYLRDGTGDIRVVVQLRDNVRSVLKKLPGRYVLEVENRYGVFNQKTVEEFQTTKEKREEVADSAIKINVPKSNSLEDILENITLSGRKKYVGKRISLNVKSVGVQDVLTMLSEASGFNIIYPQNKITELNPMSLNLINTPWDQVLDTVLDLNKLVAKKNGVILTIQTLDDARKEQEKELKAKALISKDDPLVTKIFRIGYGSVADISRIVNGYLTKERGTVSSDERTNSLIVKDTNDIVEKITKVIKVLDTKTPQILIESKIVEVSESHSKNLGLGGSGAQFTYDPLVGRGQASAAATGTAGAAAVNSLTSNTGPGLVFSSAPNATSSDFLAFKIGKFNRLLNLDLTLQLMESESKAKILSTPKIITQNKKQATIASTRSETFANETTTEDVTTRTFESDTAAISLVVTPQVTHEGSIIMDIKIEKSSFGNRPAGSLQKPEKITNTMETNVLAENGSTIVLGGLYEHSRSESHSGVPFLKNVPILGWLFRSAHNPAVTKRELLIFLTPRVVEQNEAKLLADK